MAAIRSGLEAIGKPINAYDVLLAGQARRPQDWAASRGQASHVNGLNIGRRERTSAAS